MSKDWKKMETLKYVTGLMNHLSILGAREEMRKLGSNDILSHVGEDPHKTQLLLEYTYVGQRVGTGIRKKILDEETILTIWLPQWWVNLWEKLKPLVEKERKTRNINKIAYDFEWLAERLKKKYQ